MARSDATERAGDEPTGDAETLAEGPRERAARLAVGSGHVPAISLGGDGAEDDLKSGEVVGTLRIVRRLGSGGMGVVYLARDLELEREVAVKVHREVGSFERLQREAVAMAQLAHPNVVTVHGVGRVDGRPYVAMEFIAGPTLAEWVKGEVRSWRQVLGLMLAVSDGLAAAHDAGFVHRDLKPSNILIGRDGRPRVSDFGLVRLADSLVSTLARGSSSFLPVDPGGPRQEASQLDHELTVTGTMMGTPAYMAPEQLASRPVDARADQFSYCVVLYEALYGRRPWRSNQAAGSCPPATPPRGRAPVRLWRVLRRGLSPDPHQRHADMRSLAAALRDASRRRALPAVLVGVGAIALGIAAWRVAPSGTELAAGIAGSSCGAAGARIDEVWNPRVAGAVEASADLDRAIRAWAVRWRSAAIASCRQRQEGDWREPIAVASGQCLDEGLSRLRGLVSRTRSARDAAAVAGLPIGAAALPAVEACVDPASLSAHLAATAAPELPAPVATAGFWYGTFGGQLFRRVGDEVWAPYNHDSGMLRGRLVGDTFVGWWCEEPSRLPPADAGDIELRFVTDATGAPALDGRWRYGAGGPWREDWDAAWTRGTVPPELVQRFDNPFQFCARP